MDTEFDIVAEARSHQAQRDQERLVREAAEVANIKAQYGYVEDVRKILPQVREVVEDALSFTAEIEATDLTEILSVDGRKEVRRNLGAIAGYNGIPGQLEYWITAFDSLTYAQTQSNRYVGPHGGFETYLKPWSQPNAVDSLKRTLDGHRARIEELIQNSLERLQHAAE